MLQLSFFIGKGGVGKTTVSSAYALWSAARNPRSKILLVSTDPAHSLADVLEMKLSDKAKRVASSGRLFARQIDPEAQVRKFLDAEREGILSVVEGGTFFTRQEIEPLLDATLPGMAEVAALIALHQLLEADDYDEIVVDTAPMGHTLRLFEMPEHFAKFVAFLQTASSRDAVLARTFGGATLGQNPLVAAWQGMLDRVRGALAGADSRLILVTTPEPFALAESVRARDWLRLGEAKLEVREIILNRAVTKPSNCENCRARYEAARKALGYLRREFKDCQVRVGEDPGGPVLGSAALLDFGTHVFKGTKLRWKPGSPKIGDVNFTKGKWPQLETPLSLTLGKGGVGKTTISAGLGVHQRQANPSLPVTVCSTDPAPSLDDIFLTDVDDEPRAVLGDPKLRAVEFDAISQYRTWADAMKERIAGAMTTESAGVHLDLSFDRDVLLALLDLVPPGVDEILATFRILDMVKPAERVVIDMAPTGHALELLRTPERVLTWTRLLLKTLAAHRTLPLAQDAAVEVATVQQRTRELSKTLRDSTMTSVYPVLLAEPLPDRETERLMDELDALHVPVAGLFVNRVLLREQAGRCTRCRRSREWQMSTLVKVKKRFRDVPIYVVANFSGGIAGKRSLQSFTKEIWQM